MCTNISGLSEFIIDNNNGFLSNPNSIDLGKKILMALNSDLTLIKKEIRNKKEKLTWNNFVSNLLN